jgi:hypothetical protein
MMRAQHGTKPRRLRMPVIDEGLEQANKSSDQDIEIDDDAKRLIADLWEG